MSLFILLSHLDRSTDNNNRNNHKVNSEINNDDKTVPRG